jgi:hypothetical protein
MQGGKKKQTCENVEDLDTKETHFIFNVSSTNVTVNGVLAHAGNASIPHAARTISLAHSR